MDTNTRIRPDDRLERARRLLEDGEPTLEELARAVGISASHLQRKFTERFGLSPAEYLAQRKLGTLEVGVAQWRRRQHRAVRRRLRLAVARVRGRRGEARA